MTAIVFGQLPIIGGWMLVNMRKVLLARPPAREDFGTGARATGVCTFAMPTLHLKGVWVANHREYPHPRLPRRPPDVPPPPAPRKDGWGRVLQKTGTLLWRHPGDPPNPLREGGNPSGLPLLPIRWGALVAVLLAFLLRLVGLGEQGLWFDEAFSILLARRELGDIVASTAKDTMPPLYYWFLHFWGSAPSVDFYPRYLSLLAGTCSVALVYLVGRAVLTPRAALAGALVAAVSPFHVYFSQEVRMYGLLGVWVLVSAYGFVMASRPRGRPLGWALYGTGTLLAVYTHALGWLPSAALLLYAAATSLWGPAPPPQAGGVNSAPTGTVAPALARARRLAPPVLALGAAFLAYLPWFFVVVGQASKVFGSFWTAAPNPLSPIASLYLFFAGPFVNAALFPIALTVVLIALALTVPTTIRGPHPQSAALRLLWTWSIAPPAVLLMLSFIQPIYLERVLVGAAFPVYLLLGWTVSSLPQPRTGMVLGVLVVVVGFWGLRNWHFDPAFAKPPMDEAGSMVKTAWQPGEPVLHTSDGSLLPFLVYAPDLPNHLLEGDPEYALHTARVRSTVDSLGLVPVAAEQAIGDAQRFFLVVSLDHSVEYQDAAARDFDARYQRLGEETVGGIIVRTYAVR